MLGYCHERTAQVAAEAGSPWSRYAPRGPYAAVTRPESRRRSAMTVLSLPTALRVGAEGALHARARHRAAHRPRHLARPRRLRPLHSLRHRNSSDRLGSRDQRSARRRAFQFGRRTQNPRPVGQPRRPGTRHWHPRRRDHWHRRPQRRAAGQGSPSRLRTTPVPLLATQSPWPQDALSFSSPHRQKRMPQYGLRASAIPLLHSGHRQLPGCR